MHPLTAAVRVKGRVTSGFGLCWGHALEVKRVNGMGDVLTHDGEHLLLPLQGSYALEGRRDDADVEVVAGAVKVDDLNHGIGNSLEDFGFNPRLFNHRLASIPNHEPCALNLIVHCAHADRRPRMVSTARDASTVNHG